MTFCYLVFVSNISQIVFVTVFKFQIECTFFFAFLEESACIALIANGFSSNLKTAIPCLLFKHVIFYVRVVNSIL
jgi:hypothetical protein